MRKILVTLAAAALMITLIGCSSGTGTENTNNTPAPNNTESSTPAPQYKDGTYTAVGQGKAGDVKVEVKVAEGKIAEINVLDNNETPAMLDSVKGSLVPEIITKQSTEGLDAVSGATMSSNAVLEAVDKALSEAGK